MDVNDTYERGFMSKFRNLREDMSIDGDLFTNFSGMFDGFFPYWYHGDRGAGVSQTEQQPVKIKIVKHQAVVTLKLAGYSKENLSIKVKGTIVTIAGKQTNDMYFTKTFSVDINRFDIGSLKAGYENGLLTVTLDKFKKVDPDAEERTVPIQ